MYLNCLKIRQYVMGNKNFLDKQHSIKYPQYQGKNITGALIEKDRI